MTTVAETETRTVRRGRLARAARVTAALGAAGVVACAGLAYTAWTTVGPVSLASSKNQSRIVVDRDGRLLRAFTTPEGRWRLPVAQKDVDPRYIAMLLAFEDKRFYRHAGVDPQALLRAAAQFVQAGRIVSGASTLTMQVSRLLDGRHERSARGKLRQIIRAIRLERRLSKRQIMALYLRLAPFGGNIEGLRAASLTYFGKEPRRLSVGEAALLVALPQSPEARRPDRHPKSARAARERVLQRAVEANVISAAEAERARHEPIPRVRHDFPKLAPHLAESEVARAPHLTVIRLTVQRRLQASLEALVRQHAAGIDKSVSAALLAVDHATGEIIAHVGSANYFDARRFGSIDMVDIVRSPGSTLKPLIYGLAFEDGLAHPETLIDDRPTRFGTYAPKNFGDDFNGTVTVREALGRSLNIPAVKLLDAVGPGRLVGRMQQAGIKPNLPEGAVPSLPIALGGVGLTLRDLATMYAAIARGGSPVTLRHRVGQSLSREPAKSKKRPLKQLLTHVAAAYVTNILKDAPPPPNARGGRIAYKTGTSWGHRDAWAVGYDGRHTVAVWVGRPDAASTPGLMGRTAAAPILFDAFQRISRKRAAFPPMPADALVRTGATLPEPLKRFEKGLSLRTTGLYLDPPVRIAFPPDRSEVEAGGVDAPVVLRATGGALPLTWLADGRPIGKTGRDRQIIWTGDGTGFVKLSVIDANGRVDRVTVRLRRSQ
ncbi:MAG: penicillin-binding protein 1C [Hyphomicrobiaceae bacterium]|nr:penicillin-binding protein 1C [Hyphomicrobiaceae bacterium]